MFDLIGFTAFPKPANDSRPLFRKTLKLFSDKLGLDLVWGSPDRRVLEEKILPWLSTRSALRRVLFVGCEWYTYGYRKGFHPDSYWTLDYDPRKKIFGAPSLHVIDSMTNLARHFKGGSLDLIICNGVFGWGLNASADVETAFRGVYDALRPGGLFLLGWNDIPARRPVAIDCIAALRVFRPSIMEPLGVNQYLARGANRHTYNLYTKSEHPLSG